MGLIAGISVISLIELIYHLMSAFISKKICSKTNRVSPENNRTKLIVNDSHVLYQFSKYFVRFIKASSIHGIVFITERDRSRSGKLFWFVIMLISFGACSYLINDAKNHAELNPISFSIDENIWNVEDVS